MEYIDIVFKGVSTKLLNDFIKSELDIRKNNIINSHFYSEDLGDFEYTEEIDLEKYFSQCNTANIFVKQIKLNQYYNNVLCIISSDDKDAEISCTISEKDFDKDCINELIEWINSLCQKGIITAAQVCSDLENECIINIKK